MFGLRLSFAFVLCLSVLITRSMRLHAAGVPAPRPERSGVSRDSVRTGE